MDHAHVLCFMHPNELRGRKSQFKFGGRGWDELGRGGGRDRSPPCIRLMSSLIQEAPGATSQSDFNQMFIMESNLIKQPLLLRTRKDPLMTKC